MPTNRTAYMRDYMMKRRAKQSNGERSATVIQLAPRIRDANWRRRQQMKAFAAQASVEAALYWQPPLTAFPESPRLQAMFDECMERVRAEPRWF